MRVESEFGKGSCFSIALPVSQPLALAASFEKQNAQLINSRIAKEQRSEQTERKEYQHVK